MKKLVFYISLLTVVAACKEKYELPYTGPSGGYLVVEGMINSGVGPTNIRLSRTLALVDSIAARPETNADVWVEGDNNTSFPLAETQQGLYSSPQLNLQSTVQYRVRIHTSDGKVYFSAFSPNKKTPDIDDIPWEKNSQGVTLFVNTHDPQNNTLYYQWTYEETWEFHSAYTSFLQYVFHPVTLAPMGVTSRDPDETWKMFYCWSNERSSNILIGSSVRLERDTIHLPLTLVPMGSEKISVLYSILVKQHAISRENYEFLQRMKKNTEQVGTLFDAQPSELIGNIQCADDPTEIVIGFVGVSEEKEKRIWINASEVSPWNYFTGCFQESIFNHPDSINLGLIPTSVHEYGGFGNIVRYYASTPSCVDCTTRGFNVKPSFWP